MADADAAGTLGPACHAWECCSFAGHGAVAAAVASDARLDGAIVAFVPANAMDHGGHRAPAPLDSEPVIAPVAMCLYAGTFSAFDCRRRSTHVAFEMNLNAYVLDWLLLDCWPLEKQECRTVGVLIC